MMVWTVIFIAGLSLAGWTFGLPFLKSFHGGIAMNPATALSLILTGTALLLLMKNEGRQARLLAALCGTVVLVMGLGVWLRYVTGLEFTPDRWLFHSKLDEAGSPPNQMAPNTAVAFIFSAAALLVFRRRTQRGFCPAQVFAVLTGIIALTALIGYTYRELVLYRIGNSIPMALNTAICFGLLSAAMLCAQSDRGIMAVLTSDTSGGETARRLLPAALLIPTIIGAIRLMGERKHFFSLEEGVALFAVTNIVIFTLLIWWNARQLYQSDFERQRSETRLKLQYTTTRVFSESATPKEAIAGVLNVICDTLGWQTGAMWEVDTRSNFINCTEVWRRPGFKLEEFEAVTRQAAFPPGTGLPGRVWATAQSVWIEDVVPDRNFPRAPIAQRVGLHAALGFPIQRGGEVIGVMEFFSERIERPDKQLLRLFAALGAQIGQFIERNHMERALRDSEALYHSLVETLPVNILRKDLKGRITFGNKRYSETMGRPMAELIGKTDADLFPPDLAKKYMNDDRRVIETGKIFEDVEAHRRSGWEQYYMQVVKAPVFDAHGKIIGTQVIFWDVTARKRAEQALEQTAAELARSNRELEQFAYVASHDLQEPLRMITAYTQLLQRRYKTKLDQEANEFISYAVDGALRMQKLIQDLLAYSRVGSQTRPFEVIETGKALEAAMANLHVAMSDSGAKITQDAMPKVCGDLGQLIQLFQNLLGNAIKFQGSESPRIHIGVENKQGDWVFSVRDNGIGIDPQYFRRIFVIFQRLHTHHDYPGTGIGLAVCKKIVERHQGRIWVESQPGHGTIFYFTLPADNLAKCA
jgi:PAS domain S-box-containing protein